MNYEKYSYFHDFVSVSFWCPSTSVAFLHYFSSNIYCYRKPTTLSHVSPQCSRRQCLWRHIHLFQIYTLTRTPFFSATAIFLLIHLDLFCLCFLASSTPHRTRAFSQWVPRLHSTRLDWTGIKIVSLYLSWLSKYRRRIFSLLRFNEN